MTDALTDLLLPIVLSLLVLILVIVIVVRTVVIVRQADTAIVERLGRYNRTLKPGLNLLIPLGDRVRTIVDMREQVVSFPPQAVITEDNLVVSIDTVVYFQVTEPRAATYEIMSYLTGIEQLTVTTLRNVIGSMDLEQTLTSRDSINAQLRGVLDDATGKWGIRVNRVELKAIDPPPSVQDSMEKQLRAERERRAAILTAEGQKQASILTAEGQKQAAILMAEGDAQAALLRADAEAAVVQRVYTALHAVSPEPEALAHRYIDMLPKIAAAGGSTTWVIPAELSSALGQLRDGLQGRPQA
jgi:regulator of protease activity HflC (stomatin/prohibitin superfamily)